MTCIHYKTIQNIFTALKILCSLPIHPLFPPPTPRTYHIFFPSHQKRKYSSQKSTSEEKGDVILEVTVLSCG